MSWDAGAIADCLARASSCLAACSRPSLGVTGESTREQLSAALTELVTTAELFSSQPAFWRWAAEAAALLGRDADAQLYRSRTES